MISQPRDNGHFL